MKNKKNSTLKRYIFKKALAKSMAEPIKKKLEYQGIGSKMLKSEMIV